VLPPSIDSSTWLRLMGKDKKADQGKMKFILLNAIGKAVIVEKVSEVALAETLSAGTSLAEAPN